MDVASRSVFENDSTWLHDRQSVADEFSAHHVTTGLFVADTGGQVFDEPEYDSASQ